MNWKLLVIISLFLVPIHMKAQTSAITIQITNASFDQILQEIEKQSGYLFSYPSDIAKKKVKHSLFVQNATLDETLKKFLTPLHIRYLKVNKQIILSRNNSIQPLVLSGIVHSSNTKETIQGATISIMGTSYKTSTNSYGFFSIRVPQNKYEIVISKDGYKTDFMPIELSTQMHIDIYLSPSDSNALLPEVKVYDRRNNQQKSYLGSDNFKKDISICMFKRIPCISGENDILKTMTLLPGIKRGQEYSIGMFVRGGDDGENLILMDEATIYNPGHALGLISVLNTNSIKDVQVMKGGFAANYGGRVSSIFDIHMKEGNLREFQVDGGVGILAANVSVQGPIIKDKASFIISARSSYLDKLNFLFRNSIVGNYYDINLKANYQLNKRNKLFISSYIGDDEMSFQDKAIDTIANAQNGVKLLAKYGNYTTTFRWNHVFKNYKLFSNTTLVQTRYRYFIEGSFMNKFQRVSALIKDYSAKIDLQYNPNTKHQIKFGGFITDHNVSPNNIISTINLKDTAINQINTRNNLGNIEAAIYAMDEFSLGNSLKVNAGFRYSGANAKNTIYTNFEPRLNLSYQVSQHTMFRLGYSRMAQYMLLISNGASTMPTDLWYPVSKKIKPLLSDQFVLVYNRLLEKLQLGLQIEAYYKKSKNIVSFNDYTSVFLNNNIEQAVVIGESRNYGIEAMLSKNYGRYTGWVGYTYSIAKRTFDELNIGESFYANYDRRHDISILNQYKISKRWSVSCVWVYSSGSPFTGIVGTSVAPSPGGGWLGSVPIYSSRNAFRFSSSHRADIDLSYSSSQTRKFKHEFHLSVYNLYNRTQPNRIVFNENKNEYRQAGLFGIIPTLSYQLHWK